VIVRLMGEGQFRLEGDALGRLNELDDRAQEALDRDDEAELDRYLDEMAGLVRREGEMVPDDEIVSSEAIVPPSDLSLDEAKQFFSEQGLIPDLPN
jgi:PspA-Associated protein